MNLNRGDIVCVLFNEVGQKKQSTYQVVWVVNTYDGTFRGTVGTDFTQSFRFSYNALDSSESFNSSILSPNKDFERNEQTFN